MATARIPIARIDAAGVPMKPLLTVRPSVPGCQRVVSVWTPLGTNATPSSSAGHEPAERGRSCRS